ncbi:hypothetical protein KAR91_67340, partial [Candidatus Pacearchaeota archaeon]|nr:hypothetical protein [Candidatus Pacearchaeota archaeon]
MFSKSIKRFISKVTATVMLFGIIAPFTFLAHAAGNGTVTVRTDNAFGSYEILDENDLMVGNGQGNSPNNHLLPTADAGSDYRIVYGALNGFDTPPEDSFTLFENDTLNYVGSYIVTGQLGNGTLVARTDNAFGSYQVLDVNDLVVGTGQGNSEKTHILPADTAANGGTDYRIVYGDVNGFNTPATVAFTINANETVNQTPAEGAGIYIATASQPTASVNVYTNILAGNYQILDVNDVEVGNGQGNTITSHILLADAAGTDYRIVFGAVAGYNTPADYPFTVTENDIIQFGPEEPVPYFTGMYTHDGSGTVEAVYVRTSHPNGSYLIYDVNDAPIAAGSGDTFTQFDLPANADNYYIAFNNVTGLVTPNNIPFALNVGDLEMHIGVYRLNANTGSLSVTVLNEAGQEITDGNWELRLCTGMTTSDCGDLVDPADPAVVGAGGTGTS